MTLAQLLSRPEITPLSDTDAAAALNAARSDLVPGSIRSWVGIENNLGPQIATAAKMAVLTLMELAPNIAERARIQLIDQQLTIGVDFGLQATQDQLTVLAAAGVDGDLVTALRGLGLDRRSLATRAGLPEITEANVSRQRALTTVVTALQARIDAVHTAFNAGADAAALLALGD